MGSELQAEGLRDVAVHNDITVTKQSGWLSTELLEDASLRKIAEIPTSPDELVNAFFNWQFQTGAFDFGIIAATNENPILKIIRRNRLNWPQVILDTDNAKLNQASLVRIALRGFQLIVATNSGANEVIDFFRSHSYRQVGSSPFSSGEKHDPLRATWNREDLTRSIAIASRMGAKLICCFAHDADPIYLLLKQ